jgi:hypothetical protein
VEPSESERLHLRVRAFIDASARDLATAEPFAQLALDLAAHQARHIPAIARLFRARGFDPALPGDVDAIPAVPTDVFRLTRVAAFPEGEAVRVFRTSGTTQGAFSRGEHALRTTATYEAAALAWGRRKLFPDGGPFRVIVLAPPLSEAPDSSLGFMLDHFARAVGREVSWHVRFVGEGLVLDAEGVRAACNEARAAGEAALLLGTSFAFVHLLDALAGEALPLPPGSRVMQTGGFKGRSREVAREVLRAELARTFALVEARIVAEYGMTELSSQLYEGGLAALLGGAPAPRAELYVPPPWLRVSAVDPVSLAPLPAGEVGLGRFVDLANVDSAVAVLTADRVRIHAGGVELLGRQPGAPPRGCSLAIDEMLGAPIVGAQTNG